MGSVNNMKKDNNKGFTLIEILIAMVIISLIASIFFMVMNSSIKFNKKNEIDIFSMNIAQSVIEDIRNDIKQGKSIGLDMDLDGKDDENFIIYNNWIENSNIETYKHKLKTIKHQGNISYDIFIDVGDLKREKKSDLPKRYIYTIKLNVKPNMISQKAIFITTRIYT